MTSSDETDRRLEELEAGRVHNEEMRAALMSIIDTLIRRVEANEKATAGRLAHLDKAVAAAAAADSTRAAVRELVMRLEAVEAGVVFVNPATSAAPRMGPRNVTELAQELRVNTQAMDTWDLDATHYCPRCGTQYTCAGECGQNQPFYCREKRVPISRPPIPTGGVR